MFEFDNFSPPYRKEPDDVKFSYLELTNTFELRAVVSANTSETTGGVIANPQVALLLRHLCTKDR